MCMIKVRPEIEEPAVVPARVVRHGSTRNSTHGSHRSRNRSRTSVRGDRDRETTTVIETIKIPPPQPASHNVDRTETTHTMIIQGAHPSSAQSVSDLESRHNGSHWGGRSGSPRASVVSTRSNRDVDYYVDSSASHAGRSPRASGIRYVDGNPRGSSQRITDGAGGSRGELGYSGSQRGGERYGYNNFHGRRSGSVSYVNPRHSAVSQRSARETREKVVVVDQYGNERYY